MSHRIAAITFRRATLDCTCGALVRGDRDMPHSGAAPAARAGTPEALKLALAEHRREQGAPPASDKDMAYGRDSEGRRWNGTITP